MDTPNLPLRYNRGGGHTNLRVVVTGPVGVDKKPYLEALAHTATQRGNAVRLFNVGDMMYKEAPDVAPGRILDLPLGRLNSLRRAVFKEILNEVNSQDTIIVNTHASFRWKHGLFPAFDHDQMLRLDADLYITLIDNADVVYERLRREHAVQHTLKDVLVWREEEILATEVLANAIRGHGCFFIVARGIDLNTVESMYKLIFSQGKKKCYPSFPMTHVVQFPNVLATIDAFRRTMAEHFITFDPGDVDEKRLLIAASEASSRGEAFVTEIVNGRELRFAVEEIFLSARDIDAQIYARDFKLIDQSDMIVSFIPELPDGRPSISSGVERELQHAYEVTKEVFVIWQPKAIPSPFITATATKVFYSLNEALQHFQRAGYIDRLQLQLIE